MSKRKRIHDVVQTGEDVKKITGAIASGISTLDIEDALRDLGLKVRVDTVDWNTFGTITIEGGENESGVILTLRLVKVEVGWDTLNIGDPKPEGRDS